MIERINNIRNTEKDNFLLIAGPCVIEEEKQTFDIAERILKITNKYHIPFVFKASFRKANRSRIDSFTGIGDVKALEILKTVGKELNIPTITDIHSTNDAELAAKYVDILQIPAFLCRQTDLLLAAAKTEKYVNIKKGQFLSAESIEFAINKIKESSNRNIMVTERGNMYGYQDMIVDFRCIPIMQKFQIPVILDVTHSLQKPNQYSGVTGGNPEMIETIAKAGIAVGADGIFIETHPNPKNSKSDGFNLNSEIKDLSFLFDMKYDSPPSFRRRNLSA